MMGFLRKLKGKINFLLNKKLSHGDQIKKILLSNFNSSNKNLVFVESGCGLSTLAFSEMGKNKTVTVYSCDINTEKADELMAGSGEMLNNVEFLIGNSLDSFVGIAKKHDVIDFLFLDSAASAMHTFKEFQAVEQCLKPGACVLIDNAAIPGAKRLLSPVRKGKILVPYLLASPYWEVVGHPEAGDSMVSAVMHSEANYADAEYEDPEYIDQWKMLFDKKLDA